MDSKYHEFSNLIRNILGNLDNPQVVVFSFFVRTLKYLQRRLQAEGYRVGIITGEMPLESDGKHMGRYEVIEAFERGELDILLSSEVGGEGLDFQFCQAMVNYDLPYNPMRIEQRIGRIDRFGQKAEKIVVASMYIEGTVDERIYNTLYERIQLVEDSIGVMEPILGSKLADLQREMIGGSLSAEQLEVRTREIQMAVEQSKIEYAKFEANRQELLGDDHFTRLFHDMEKGNNFVGPSDAARLTAIYLTSEAGCEYREVDKHRALIVLSKDVHDALEQYARRPGSEGSHQELGLLLNKSKTPIKVIFNGSMADQYRDHVFLPPCGFWIRFLISQLEFTGNMRKVFAVKNSKLRAEGLEPGSYLVPLFEIKTEGFRTELDLAAVPVQMSDGIVVNCDYKHMSRIIGQGIRESDELGDFSDHDWNELTDRAREALEISLEEKMDKLRLENEYRIEARIGSLEKGSEVRIERLMKRAEVHQQHATVSGKSVSPEFIRMIEAQIANESGRTADKVNKLLSQKELSMAMSLVGVVVLQVEETAGEGGASE